jgi:hypothetical protein
MAAHRFRDDEIAHFFIEGRVTGDMPRLDECGFGLHVLVRFGDAIFGAANDMAHLQPAIPQHIKKPLGQGLQGGLGFTAGDLVDFVQKQNINVAEGVEFAAAIAAEGNEGVFGNGGFFGGEVALDGADDGAEQNIQDFGAGVRDFLAAAAAFVEQMHAMAFHPQEILVARDFLGRGAAFGNLQAARGVNFNLLRKRH